MMLAMARDESVEPKNWSSADNRLREVSEHMATVVLVRWKPAVVQKTIWFMVR